MSDVPETTQSNNTGLCAYKNYFGAPRTGLHQYRLFDIALVDVIATLVLARLISSKHWLVVGGLLVAISIPIHKAFCVDSTLTRLVVK